MGFVDSLRMNNIMAPSGGGVMGPPDFSGGGGGSTNDILGTIMDLRNKAKMQDDNRQRGMLTFQNDMQRRNQAMDQKEADRRAMFTPNTAVRWPDEERNSNRLTDYQSGQLQNAAQRNQIQAQNYRMRDQNSDADREIRQQRADTYSNMHDLSDAERLDLTNKARAGDMQAKALLDQALENLRQTGRMAIANVNNEAAMSRLNVGGTQNLSEIAARVAGDRDVANIRANQPYTPQETRTNQWNQAQGVANDPAFSGVVSMQPGGMFQINPPGYGGVTDEQFRNANQRIYGSPNGNVPNRSTDIALPSSTPANALPGYNPPHLQGTPSAVPGSKYSGSVTVNR